MFTGLVDDVGTIERVSDTDAGRELVVRTRYANLADGESIALNGVCLTVREHEAGTFTAAAFAPTIGRTTVGDWAVGSRVNLERALVAGAPLGGHLVQGHVDGVATVSDVRREGDALLVELAVPTEVAELSVLHGSIAVNGVSLTINTLAPNGRLGVALIEYTLRHTTLGELAAGARVHVEADVIGKYVQRMVAPYLAASRGS